MILEEDWKFLICLFLDKNKPRRGSSSYKIGHPRLAKYGFYIVGHTVSFKRVSP